MKRYRNIWLVAGVMLLIAYIFVAAQPIPPQTVLIPRWINSLESGNLVYLGNTGADEEADGDNTQLLPFSLGDRFGFVGHDGRFSISRVKRDNVSLSSKHWAEYEAEPSRIIIHDSAGEVLSTIENPRGYPFFFDDRTFIINSEQNAVSEIDASGAVSWTYEFAAPLTCVDSAAGLLLAGSLDGSAVVLDSSGNEVFSFEPGGSRYSIILGCAISSDGSRLALVSGIDRQRFLLLERFGTNLGDYKVVYHEFLDEGFRRPVHIYFVENDRWVVFERMGGLGFYDVHSRRAANVALHGEITAIDHSDGQGLVFAIVSRSGSAKELVCISLPGRVIMAAPFKSDEVFLGRMDSRLLIGGGQTIISFDLEKR